VSRLHALLTSTEPLEPHEIADLRNWLNALKRDCDVFGETAQDTHRIATIHARIQFEEAREPLP
jgi:hypothetical protein